MAKILLVEDHEINRDMILRRLERKGYEVVVAVNGEEAVAKAQIARPDVILMDLHLPVMDGWEATRQIKADVETQAIPVIALTADALAGERERAIAAGCDDYDTKPVDLPRLLQKIEQQLQPAVDIPIVPNAKASIQPNQQQLQQQLRAALRRDLDSPLYSIIGYSDLLLATIAQQQVDAHSSNIDSQLFSDIRKLFDSGMQLLDLVHGILNPILASVQRQDSTLFAPDILAPALRRELRTPLSTIMGYCEMLLEEAPSEYLSDLEHIHVSAQDLLNRVNGLDAVAGQYIKSIQQSEQPNEAEASSAFLEAYKRKPYKVDCSTSDNRRILLVGADSYSCALIVRQLESMGCQTTVVMDSQQALEVIAAQPYDLILLEADKLNLLEQLKQNPDWQNIPVLLMVAPDDRISAIRGLYLGATDYLMRPFQTVMLHQKVRNCIEMAERSLTEQKLTQTVEALKKEIFHLQQAKQTSDIVQTDHSQKLSLNEKEESPQRSVPITNSPTRVLLVEDNELNRDMLSRRLKKENYEVSLAMDGAEATDKAMQELPDIILMDISLPVMDGWEATQRLKQDPQTAKIPIIALTAHAMAGDREKSLAAGCDDYDTKPIDLSRLLGKIEGCLQCSAR